MQTMTAQEQILSEAAERLGYEIVNEPIQPGDLYLAVRNTGVKILVCKEVDSRNWVIPTSNAYCYDTWECKKVRRGSY